MPVKRVSLALLLLGSLLLQPVLAAELATLFTTPEERALIDRNRYKEVEVQPEQQQVEVVDDISETPNESMTFEREINEYLISGITISQTGPHTVWINSRAYEDGARLEDNSRVKVLPGNEIRVRITAPDGRHYYATSGETLAITTLKPARAQP